MDNDPISQLPEPYCAALNVLHSSSDMDTLLKSVLENAINMVDADWGITVLNAYSPISSYSSIVRALPDVQLQSVEKSGVSFLVYSLACEAMQQNSGRIIPDVTLISSQEKQDVMKKYLSPWMLDSLNQTVHTEESTSLILAPIYASESESAVLVFSRPADPKPFDKQSLAEVELFISLISKHVNMSVLLDKSTKKNSELIRFMAFEVKSQLTMIRGYTDLLLSFSENGNLTDTQTRFLQTIKQSVERTNRMLNNFVDTATLEANQLRFEKVGFDIRDFLSVQLQHLKPLFEGKNQQVILKSGNETILYADRGRIEEIIEIMIRNASAYSSNNSEIKVSAEKQNDHIRISVSDNGIGLTNEEKSHLFQQFYRSARREVREQAGIGLELFIAKKIIEKMGGQIGAEGTENQGSIFWFTLPIKE